MTKWTRKKAKATIKRGGGLFGNKFFWVPRPGIKLLGACDFLVAKGYKRI